MSDERTSGSLASLVDDFDRARGAARGRRGGGGWGAIARRFGAAAGVIALAGVAGAVALDGGGGDGADLAAASRRRALIDVETGEVFAEFRVPDGASAPFVNPRTGARTLQAAERCHWGADGRAKWAPTYVLIPAGLSEVACPDCGRTVVPRNPLPPEGLMLEALEREGRG